MQDNDLKSFVVQVSPDSTSMDYKNVGKLEQEIMLENENTCLIDYKAKIDNHQANIKAIYYKFKLLECCLMDKVKMTQSLST